MPRTCLKLKSKDFKSKQSQKAPKISNVSINCYPRTCALSSHPSYFFPDNLEDIIAVLQNCVYCVFFSFYATLALAQGIQRPTLRMVSARQLQHLTPAVFDNHYAESIRSVVSKYP